MILPSGIWTQETADATHQSSQALADFLIGYLDRNKPTFDFGCGIGFYLSQLEKNGFNDCFGIEGFKLNNSLNKNTIVHDLTNEIVLTGLKESEMKYKNITAPAEIMIRGNVISLEVGEHLPPAAQETFMKTITGHCDQKLIFSWAEIGQPGLGHINCRDQNEVIADVEGRGFLYLNEITNTIRATIENNCSWFQRTLLIFERIK